MKKEMYQLFDREINNSVVDGYKKLISFIDAALSQSFKISGDDRAEFLVKNLLNMRDFMSSEILVEDTKIQIKDNVVKLFEKFVKDHDLDLESMEEALRKKKESEYEEKQQLLENSSEINPSTSSSEEES